MAGNYDDVPGPRMAYDRDGTITVEVNVTTGLALEVDDQFNAETAGGRELTNSTIGYAHVGGIAVLFPELRDIDGYYVLTDGYGTYWGRKQIQYSPDTTNGIDGSWIDLEAAPHTTGDGSKIEQRDAIKPASVTGVKAFRVLLLSADRGSRGLTVAMIHLYGAPSSGEAPNRLRFWHPTLDQEVGGAYFDWGDIPRSTTVDKDFRIKNPSATLTAETVGLTMEALTDTTPSNVGQHTFSTDGIAFTSSVNLGDLAPDTISPVVTLRRGTTTDAVFSLWWTRIVASASAWS